MIVNNELKRMWEWLWPNLRDFPKLLSGGTQENHKRPCLGNPVSFNIQTRQLTNTTYKNYH